MKPRRRGYSLVECLVMMVLISATLGAVSWTLHTLFRAERQLRDALTEDRCLDRFIAQLRSDAHQAISARADRSPENGGPPADLLLVLPGERRVQYALQPGSAERIVLDGETATARETYALPGSPAGWQLRGDGPSTRVSLRLDRAGFDSKQPPSVPMAEIEVAVGLFRSPLPEESE